MQQQIIKLRTGAEMPVIGLGTWNARKDKVGPAVQSALVDFNYAHIDCARVYENEGEVGQALQTVFSSGQRKREEVFITSKLWNDDHAKEDVRSACEQTLNDLQLDYLDLYLMHFGVASPKGMGIEPVDDRGFLIPAPVSVRETWEAMETLLDAGLVKAIGVSNFSAPMLMDLLTYAKVKPAVNQVEIHPYNQQGRLIEFCRHYDIVVTAYSPLGSQEEMNAGKPSLLADPAIQKIAERYEKSPAQILLRWGIQRNTVVIPKSTSHDHIKENMDVFNFALNEEDMRQIASLDRRLRYVDPWEWWRMPYFG